MTTLQEVNEYEERLNRRLIDFGIAQKIIERQREDFWNEVDKKHQEEKDKEAIQERDDSLKSQELESDGFITIEK